MFLKTFSEAFWQWYTLRHVVWKVIIAIIVFMLFWFNFALALFWLFVILIAYYLYWKLFKTFIKNPTIKIWRKLFATPVKQKVKRKQKRKNYSKRRAKKLM